MQPQARAPTTTFADYLRAAIELAWQQRADEADDGNLDWMLERAAVGVQRNWEELTADVFMRRYLFCVGSIQKSYARRMDPNRPGGSFWDRQQRLFRDGDPFAIAHDAARIRKEWQEERVDLSPRMVEAVLDTAERINDMDWEPFAEEYLLLPDNPDSERFDDWLPAMRALRRLKMVGPVLAQYLLRNLYGAPFFKPDIHIIHIADRFFHGKLDALAATSKAGWNAACPPGSKRLLRNANLGIIDYVLWNYRRAERAAELAAQRSTTASDGQACRTEP